MRRFLVLKSIVIILLSIGLVYAAIVVPTDIEQPGTQPGEVALEASTRCHNCHGNYDLSVEPTHNWRGSMMANATRDPIFWATLAITEQDFDGSGDLCLRCHTTDGWTGGRSTPTDGSALLASDADGVSCDLCHKATNPNNSEHIGVQNDPYIANDGGIPAIGYYGSGMYSLWNGNEKLGPYSSTVARHSFMQSNFHRSRDFCGTCHDVSNPAVGDLALNNGAQLPLAPGTYSGSLNTAVTGKAAFHNFPYAYGVVERTFSEYKSSLLSEMRISDYTSLPSELKAGALKDAYDSSLVAGQGGDYEDGTPRYFGCQVCHVPPVTGKGCNKSDAPLRRDLPLHDMTGGNYWMPDAITYLNSQNKLRLGGSMTTGQLYALYDGKIKAQNQLNKAVSLSVNGNTLRVVNLTGHKLISGYPEGRRMWLNIKWYNINNVLIREDGKYDLMTVNIKGTPTQVKTILDLNDPNTKIYEAHYAITKEWASKLIAVGVSPSLPLSYDRITGAIESTLGDLASQPAESYEESFHFVLNN